MAQKAKLDILDIPLPGDASGEKGPPAKGDGGKPEAAPDSAKPPWYRRRVVWAGAAAGLLAAALVAVSLVLWERPDRRHRPDPAILAASGVPASSAANVATVEEFYVDLKDASGKPRLAVVGLVLEPADGKFRPEMNGPDVRKAVHALLSGKTAEELRRSAEREKLRKEIVSGINLALKKEAVRTVWFSDLNVW